MAENTINDYNTLPEQVQINKDDITKLKDDINKIKPNAWEERKFNLDDEDNGLFKFTTYNPITDTNVPVNIQKSFTDKDTYSSSDTINSYSFAASAKVNSSGSLSNLFAYAVCANPSMTIKDILNALSTTSKNAIIFLKLDNDQESDPFYLLNINCTDLKAETFRFYNSDLYIDTITANDDKSIHSMLTAYAIDNYYLKKTDASNTYVTKQDYEERIDTGYIQFTTQGWTKFKAITDTEGRTIELNVPADLLEHVQVTGTRDLKLQLIYNDHAVFENIYLHPNNTINNLDYITGAKTTYYTGQAMLTLSTQSNGLFYIVYQEGVSLTLRLITTI